MKQDTDQEGHNLLDQPEETESPQQPKRTPHERLALFENAAALVGFSFLLLTLIFLSIKLDGALSDSFLFSYCTFPSLISILTFSVAVLQYYSDPDNKTPALAKQMVLALCTSVAVFGILFVSFISLKADDQVDAGYVVLFTPIFILEGVTFFFVCFLLPGFLLNEAKQYKEAVLAIIYYLGTLVFTILYAKKLGGSFSGSYTSVTLPLMICVGIHILVIGLELFDKKKNFNFRELLAVILFGLFIVMSVIAQHLVANQVAKDFIWTLAFLPADAIAIGGVVMFSVKFIRSQKKN